MPVNEMYEQSLRNSSKYHPIIDVEPLFEWELEDDEEERNLTTNGTALCY